MRHQTFSFIGFGNSVSSVHGSKHTKEDQQILKYLDCCGTKNSRRVLDSRTEQTHESIQNCFAFSQKMEEVVGKVPGQIQWNEGVAETGKILNYSFFGSEIREEAGEE